MQRGERSRAGLPLALGVLLVLLGLGLAPAAAGDGAATDDSPAGSAHVAALTHQQAVVARSGEPAPHAPGGLILAVLPVIASVAVARTFRARCDGFRGGSGAVQRCARQGRAPPAFSA